MSGIGEFNFAQSAWDSLNNLKYLNIAGAMYIRTSQNLSEMFESLETLELSEDLKYYLPETNSDLEDDNRSVDYVSALSAEEFIGRGDYQELTEENRLEVMRLAFGETKVEFCFQRQ